MIWAIEKELPEAPTLLSFKKRGCVKTNISLAICFFLGTDYTENTDFLCSFFREIREIRA